MHTRYSNSFVIHTVHIVDVYILHFVTTAVVLSCVHVIHLVSNTWGTAAANAVLMHVKDLTRLRKYGKLARFAIQFLIMV